MNAAALSKPGDGVLRPCNSSDDRNSRSRLRFAAVIVSAALRTGSGTVSDCGWKIAPASRIGRMVRIVENCEGTKPTKFTRRNEENDGRTKGTNKEEFRAAQALVASPASGRRVVWRADRDPKRGWTAIRVLD